MRELAALDLYFLIKEFQILISAKIDKIFQKGQEYHFQIHVPRKGKHFLKVLPNLIYLSTNKEHIEESGKFALSLRKHISNTRIRKIEQIGFERIIRIDLEGKNNYTLFIELFRPGNIILVNEKIIMAAKYKGFGSRIIRPGIKYEHPVQENNLLQLKEKDFAKVIKSSGKKSIVITLATELGLGGFYAEHFCRKAGLDKKSNKLNEEDIQTLYKVIKEQLASDPKGYYSGDNAAPIPVFEEYEIRESFSRALEELIPEPKKEKKEDKLERIKKIQEQQIQGLKKAYEENKAKAELIYKNYSKVEKALKNPKDHNPNTKEKTITLDL